MFGGVPPAAGGVSSRRTTNESTMNNTLMRSSRGLVNNLRRTSSTIRQHRNPKSPGPVAHTTPSDTPNPSSATASLNDTFLLESNQCLPQSVQTLHSTSKAYGENGSDTSSESGRCSWLDPGTACSTVSTTSSSDLRGLKLQHAEKFSKLLPRSSPVNTSATTSLRKQLNRKPGFQDLIRASNVGLASLTPGSHLKSEWRDSLVGGSDATVSKARMISAPLRGGLGKTPSVAKPQPAILLQNQPKRPVPEGESLENVQLNLQEHILAQIAQNAIDRAPQRSPSMVRKRGGGRCLDGEVKPNERDRELEVTRELMQRVQAALNGGSCNPFCPPVHYLKALSRSYKEAILCDVMLMLRRAFRDILLSLGRPYSPTGSPVTDQEVIEEMDAYLIAHEDLNISRTQMTVQEVLKSLDMDVDKVD